VLTDSGILRIAIRHAPGSYRIEPGEGLYIREADRFQHRGGAEQAGSAVPTVRPLGIDAK
jgi:hypothetical protein